MTALDAMIEEMDKYYNSVLAKHSAKELAALRKVAIIAGDIPPLGKTMFGWKQRLLFALRELEKITKG